MANRELAERIAKDVVVYGPCDEGLAWWTAKIKQHLDKSVEPQPSVEALRQLAALAAEKIMQEIDEFVPPDVDSEQLLDVENNITEIALAAVQAAIEKGA